MSRHLVFLLSSCLITLALAMPAVAAPGGSVTATGTGQTRVVPKNRHSNSSIRAAYDAARIASIAIREAHEYALVCHAAGLILGAVVSVTDQRTGGFHGPGPGGFLGPFGPGQFCGTLPQPIFNRVNGRQKVVGVKNVRRCIVPRFAYTTLTVTYSAT